MFRNGVMEGYTAANLQECAALLDAENVYVLDREGNILGGSRDTGADFTRMRYNQLRDVFEKDELSQAFEVKTERGRFRYYGCRLDGDTMIVLEKSTGELDGLLSATSTWEAMLKSVTVGLDGFTFAVSDKDVFGINKEIIEWCMNHYNYELIQKLKNDGKITISTISEIKEPNFVKSMIPLFRLLLEKNNILIKGKINNFEFPVILGEKDIIFYIDSCKFIHRYKSYLFDGKYIQINPDSLLRISTIKDNKSMYKTLKILYNRSSSKLFPDMCQVID